MKVLILIFGCTSGDYPEMVKAAKSTWDKFDHPMVDVLYFYGGSTECCIGKDYYTGTPDDYEMQHVKYKRALDFVWDWDWDFVLRGSTSSYFDKDLVYEKALTLPREKCYMGKDGGGWASGCGHFQSRDVADIVRRNIPECPHPAEDVLTGEILQKHGITVTPGFDRFDMNHVDDVLRPCYHYRCKTTINDKKQEIEAFFKIYKYLQG